MSISVFITGAPMCMTIKRGRSTVSWQELSKRERVAVVSNLESALSVCKGRAEDDEPKKYCGKCKQLLPLSAFYKRSDNGKSRPFCKECEMDYGRRYRAKKSKRVLLKKSCDNCINRECRERITSAGFDFGKSCVNYKRENIVQAYDTAEHQD